MNSGQHPFGTRSNAFTRAGITATAAIAVAIGLIAALLSMPVAADASATVEQRAQAACKKKQGKAKRTCLKNQRQRLNKATFGVMTRNVYLGADLGPGLNAGSYAELGDGAGEILRSVDATNPPERMRVLAQEIRSVGADLVGLQELALYRQQDDPNIYLPGNGKVPKSQEVRYDFLQLLLDSLNRGRPASDRFRAAVVKNEFDFETPADIDGDNGTCSMLCSTYPGADKVVRLTMRDAIIVKSGVKVSNPASGTFGDRNGDGDTWDAGDVAGNLYTPKIAGSVDVPVTRGWTAVTASVRGSKPFRFVNTHFEAFGDDKNRVVDCMTEPAPEFSSNKVSIRCLQAKELYELVIEPSQEPVILVGDLNSDDDTVVDAACPSPANTGGSLIGNNGGLCGDTFPYNSLLTNGLRSLAFGVDDSCCGGGDRLDDISPESLARFDHHIDHIMTNAAPGRVFSRVGPSRSTGTKPYKTTGEPPYWGSDHGGVAQKLIFTK